MGTNGRNARVSLRAHHASIDTLRWAVLPILMLAAACDDRGMQQVVPGIGAGEPTAGAAPVGGSSVPPATAGVSGAEAAAGGAGAGSAAPAPAPSGGAGSVAAPMAGTPAAGAPAADAGSEPMPEPDAAVPFVDHGEGDGSDVVTIGDSWMTLGFSGIEQSLRAAGKNYRNYAAAGTTLGGSIPGQYDRAVRANPDIKTVIMTGGGNDIMFSNGCATMESCAEAVKMITMMLNTLWTKMAMDGVKDVLYINYSRDAGTSPTDTRPTTPPDPPAICLTGMIRCHSLPTTDLVMGQLLDGIHPTSAANGRIAAAVIELLEMKGARR